MVATEKMDKLRDSEIVAAIAEPLGTFAGIDEDNFNAGIIAAALASAEDNQLHEDDIGKILQWANAIQRQACALHFMLIGAVEVRVIDGELHFTMPGGSPDEMMRQLVRNGVAKVG